MKDGIIVREWIPVNHGDKEETRYLICVPEEKQEAVLRMCHSSLMSNHPGTQLTLDICRRYYYWPGMADDVTLYVAACTTCGRSKQPQSYSKATRKHIIAHEFNQILVIDHDEAEKLGLTAWKNKYILSMTDVFSGYVVAIATNSQSSEENIKLIMHKWVLRFGVPREVISDNAPGFSSKFYNAVFFALNCKTTHGLPYECRSTSKAERTNKRLNTSLRVCLDGKNPKTWDRYLDYICSSLNSMKSRATGYSANFLVFGHELNTPISLLLENSDQTDVFSPAGQVKFDQKAYNLHKVYKGVIQKVRRNLDSYYAHADMDFNKGIRNKPFNTGDLCFVQIRCPKHKFAPRWHGPVKIVKAVNEHVYVVKIGDIEKVVNISKLKKYRPNKFSSALNPQAAEFTPCDGRGDQPGSTPTQIGAQLTITSDKYDKDDHTEGTLPCIEPQSEAQQYPPNTVGPDSIYAEGPIADTESSSQGQSPNQIVNPTLSQKPKRQPKRSVRFQVDPKQRHYYYSD